MCFLFYIADIDLRLCNIFITVSSTNMGCIMILLWTLIKCIQVKRQLCPLWHTHIYTVYMQPDSQTHCSFSRWCRQWWEPTDVERLAGSNMTTGQNSEVREGEDTNGSVLYRQNPFSSNSLSDPWFYTLTGCSNKFILELIKEEMTYLLQPEFCQCVMLLWPCWVVVFE